MGYTAMRLSRGGYLIREGFRSIKTHSFMSFATVTIIMACLIIMGSISLLSLNIDALIDDLENQNEMVAYVDEKLSEEQARELEQKLLSLDNVQDVEFVTRKEAMDNYFSKFDDYVKEGIDEEVFRHRYVIHLVDIAFMADTKAQLENIEGVGDVLAHQDYADAFVTIRNIVSIVSLVLTVILVFVSIFIMTNTIKLATFGRREEIGIMKMVGATNAFIRLPFIVEGMVLGILGGGLGYLVQWGLYGLLAGRLMGTLTGSFITLVPFSTVALPLLIIYLGLGVFVGVFGALNAIRNYPKV